MDWKTVYSTSDADSSIRLEVHSPTGVAWFWSAFDTVTNEGIASAIPFATPQEAMTAAEHWYATIGHPRKAISDAL